MGFDSGQNLHPTSSNISFVFVLIGPYHNIVGSFARFIKHCLMRACALAHSFTIDREGLSRKRSHNALTNRCWTNIVGSFEHPRQTCWMMLDDVWWVLIQVKIAIQHRPTFLLFSWSLVRITTLLDRLHASSNIV